MAVPRAEDFRLLLVELEEVLKLGGEHAVVVKGGLDAVAEGGVLVFLFFWGGGIGRGLGGGGGVLGEEQNESLNTTFCIFWSHLNILQVHVVALVRLVLLKHLALVVVVLLVADGSEPAVPNAPGQVHAIRFTEGLGPCG